jgi:hypothetical protein
MDITELVIPGAKLRIDYGKGHPNNQAIEIRAIIDDDQVVYRKWSYAWKCWIYKVEPMVCMNVYLTMGHLVKR